MPNWIKTTTTNGNDMIMTDAPLFDNQAKREGATFLRDRCGKSISALTTCTTNGTISFGVNFMSNLSTTLPVSEARKNLYDVVDEAVTELKRFIITRRRGGSITVLATEEMESLEETVEILSNKRLMKDIKQGVADIKTGKTKTLREAEKSM
jgi:prevent-host-death family protein